MACAPIINSEIISITRLNNILLFVFAMLFAVQATSAVMDEYQVHKSNESSLAFDFGHDSKQQNQVPLMDEDPSSSLLDDHHCCHCHTGAQMLDSVATDFLIKIRSPKLWQYHFIYQSIAFLPHFRPPIINA